MIVTWRTVELQTRVQVRAYIGGNELLSIALRDRRVAHLWMTEMLWRFRYRFLVRADQGLIGHFLAQMTGLSRARVTRAITQFGRGGVIEDYRKAPDKLLAWRYTAADIRLLTEVDALHGTISGLVARNLCDWMYRMFGDALYERLAGISEG